MVWVEHCEVLKDRVKEVINHIEASHQDASMLAPVSSVGIIASTDETPLSGAVIPMTTAA